MTARTEKTHSKGEYYSLFIFALFSAILFFQCVVFNCLAFHSILISSIVKNPLEFWYYYLPEISLSVLIGSFSLIFKNKTWTAVFDLIFSIWILAELVYYRAFSTFIDPFAFIAVGNMNGFWDSILSFIRITDYLIFIFPLILLFVIFRHKGWKAERYCIVFLTTVVVSISLYSIDILLYKKLLKTWAANSIDNERLENLHIPFNVFSEHNWDNAWAVTSTEYMKNTSVLHSLLYQVFQIPTIPFKSPHISLEEQDQQRINSFISNKEEAKPQTNLIIILFESLENWAIDENITPNIYSLITENEHYLWAHKIKKQTLAGNSGDGQMIVNTGLLPISEGAACMRYAANVYPSLSEIYEKSALILPGSIEVWNQSAMNVAYGIDTTYLTTADSSTFKKLDEIEKSYPFIMAISMASHAPFDDSSYEEVFSDDEMPLKMRRYINCVHYTDKCLGDFLKDVQSDSTLSNCTVVITGDHTIFTEEDRKVFYQYCISKKQPFPVMDNFCPLIIYSPNIESPLILKNENYQMDIFPTILKLIGADNYYWKGFGIDLSDIDASRTIDESEAYELSDKIIRSNFYK